MGIEISRESIPLDSALGLLTPCPGCGSTASLGCAQWAPNIPEQKLLYSSRQLIPVSEPVSSFSLRQLFTFLFV